MTNQPKVILYKADPCGYCSAAIRYLEERMGLQIEIVDLTRDVEQRMELMRKTGRRTVPQIFINDVHIGGYDDLVRKDRQGEIDVLLSPKSK